MSCVTRLDVLVDHNFFLEQFMSQLPNLLELGLCILTRNGLRLFSILVLFKLYIQVISAGASISKNI